MDRVPGEVGDPAAWRRFVCDPSRAGRFLSPLGTSMTGADAPDMDPATLSAFADGLRDGDRPDMPLLAEALDLTRPDYARFVADELPALLDTLANERVAEQAVVGPALRGNPRWDRTILGRRTGTLLPTQFSSRVAARSFALPENQLVRWLASSLLEGLGTVSNRLRDRLPPSLAGLRTSLLEALEHPWFGQVLPPLDLEPHMLVCAERQRLPGYRTAAELAERRARLSSRDEGARWAAMVELLRARWLEPVDPDDLFELYALVLVLDILERDLGLGSPTEYGLVSSDRRHVGKREPTPTFRCGLELTRFAALVGGVCADVGERGLIRGA